MDYCNYRTALIALSAAFLTHSAVADIVQPVYEQNCAVCHGATGKPDANSPVVKGLGVLPADFSAPCSIAASRRVTGRW